jgi:hypothetical protein
MRRVLLLLLAVGTLGATACGAVKPRLDYSGFGIANPDRDLEIMESWETQTETPAGAAEVVVLVDTLPRGLSLADGSITVDEGYGHVVMGRFALVNQGLSFANTLWFADYEAGWRKGLCWWQTPLVWVTGTIWAFVVPLNYPCWGHVGVDTKLALESVRRLTAQAGGDLAVVSYRRHPQDPRRVFSVVGFVLKADPRLKRDELDKGATPLKRPATEI